LFCNESTILVVAPILATLLFCSGVGITATLRRTWPLLVTLVVTGAVYALIYRHIVTSAGVKSNVSLGADRWPGTGVTLQFYAEALTNTLAPGVFGGPWGSTPVLSDQVADTSAGVRAVTTGALLLLILLALVVRRRAWIPLTMAASFAVVAVALVLLSNRYLLWGEITIHDERYTLDVMVVWAFAAAMLITPALGESSAFRWAAPPWLGTRTTGLLLGAVLAISLTIANVQVISRNGTFPMKPWLHNLLGDIDRLAPVEIYDTHPADGLVPPRGREGQLSRMLSPLGDKVSFDGPAETLFVPDASGHLRAAVVARSVSASPGPVPNCGYAISSSSPQRIPLTGALFPYPWAMELTAYAGTPSVLLVEIDHKLIQIPVDKGFARHQVGFVGGAHDVQIALQPGSAPVCVTDLHIGGVTPSKQH
jgi:hypothetical protein